MGAEPPYDPSPRPLEKAQNGFVWCDTCEAVRPAAGHDCAPASVEPEPDVLRLQAEITDLHAELNKALAWLDRLGTWRDHKINLNEGPLECHLIAAVDRADRAESMLCALAFDAGLKLARPEYQGERREPLCDAMSVLLSVERWAPRVAFRVLLATGAGGER